MTDLNSLNVPAELGDPFFFPNEIKPLKKEDYQEWRNPNEVEVFSYELLFYMGEKVYSPWKSGDMHIPELFEKWRLIKTDCEVFFSNRKAGLALEPMKEGIGLFFSAVYWMNEKPVQLSAWKKQMEACPVKPINLVERLSFIMERPAFYHSFRQLSELFIELEKLFVRNKLRKAKKGLSG